MTRDTAVRLLKERVAGLERGIEYYDESILHIKRTMALYDITPGEIGMGENGLEELRSHNARKQGLKILQKMREEPLYCNGSSIDALSKQLNAGLLVIEQLGTDWREINLLAAKSQLKNLQFNGYDSYKFKMMKKYLEQAGGTVQDIGSSEQAVRRILQDGERISAERHLTALRSGKLRSDYLESVQSSLSTAELSPEDIGSSQKEIDSISRQINEERKRAGKYEHIRIN